MRLRSRGFSLIELMVAITLGLVLLAGVAQVFVNSKQGYRVQESVGRLQENARYASGYLSQYIRMADLWSGVKPASITLKSTTYAGPGSCSNGWIVDPNSSVVSDSGAAGGSRGIIGYSGDASGSALSYPANLPSGCIGSTAAPYIQGSDVIAIRYIDPNTYVSTPSLQAGASSLTTNGNFYLRTLVSGTADLFDASNQSNVTAAVNDIPGDIINGVLNYQFQNVVFFLLNADNGQNALKTTDNPNGLTPTLYMLTLQGGPAGGALTAQPLVDGIEMMKFEYGLDTNGDLQVDQYAVASAITNWTQVITVRVSFIARGDALDNYTDNQSYTMTGAGYVYTPAASARKYQRRLIVREIQLRNRVRS